jgi:hypothetical protein
MTGVRQQRCALLSQLLAEPLAATAPTATVAWLAVEHPGPWPPRWTDALSPAARAVVARATELGIRTQLVRRPGRGRAADPRRTVLVCAHLDTRPWMEQAVLDDLDGLADLDLAALAAGRRPGFGAPAADRAVMVCAHGRRDVCCAQHGRPVAAAMAAAWPGRVWETTHLAGDRFAANVACLPEGTYHGRVTARTAAAVAAACLAGRVDLPHYRGRAGLPGPAQAAEHAVRRLTGQVLVAAVVTERVDPDERGGHLVVVSAAGRRYAVPVRTGVGPPRPTSCASCLPETPVCHVAGPPRPLPGSPRR